MATDALSGTSHGNLFGLSDFWLAWWWHEVLAGVLLGLLIVTLVGWLVKRLWRLGKRLWGRWPGWGWPSEEEYESLRRSGSG